MPTECSATVVSFARVEGRRVEAGFDGGPQSSDAGALLLGETDRAIGLINRFAACFRDGRRSDRVTHALRALLMQRVFGIALGYEDLCDHDRLRDDPVLQVLAERPETALAGKSTLNRLEHAPESGGPRNRDPRYHKIGHRPEAIEDLFVTLFLEAYTRPPKRLVLDLDATDDPLHGRQEGRFFHGYYDCYCYLPLYVFCGRHLLVAKLRRANIDAAAGALEAVARLVERIRARWPRTQVLLRADSGFAREDLMAWCEANRVDFLFGLARNDRLVGHIEADLWWAEEQARSTGRPTRRFADFLWTTRDSWSRRRRVVAKAEWMPGRSDRSANPRFVVTSLKPKDYPARLLYEKVYCARGEMENRIKECQLDLFADRTSAASMRANQLRLWFASMAYVLLCALRRIGLAHTQFATASCGSIRLKLLKLGAQMRVSARRIRFTMPRAYPWQHEWTLAHARLTAAAA